MSCILLRLGRGGGQSSARGYRHLFRHAELGLVPVKVQKHALFLLRRHEFLRTRKSICAEADRRGRRQVLGGYFDITREMWIKNIEPYDIMRRTSTA